jgi:hypothetical protein
MGGRLKVRAGAEGPRRAADGSRPSCVPGPCRGPSTPIGHIGHSGGFPGINSQLDIYLGKGYTVAVMSNSDPPAADRVAQRIRTLILR